MKSLIKEYLVVILIGLLLVTTFLITYYYFNKKQETYKAIFVINCEGEEKEHGYLY